MFKQYDSDWEGALREEEGGEYYHYEEVDAYIAKLEKKIEQLNIQLCQWEQC